MQPLCLRWQDKLGANVNLLLLLCYLELRQLKLSQTELAELMAALAPFTEQFTKPLRSLRRNYQNAPATLQTTLKQHLLSAELALEQLEQQLLLAHCPLLQRPAESLSPEFPPPEPLLESYLRLLHANVDAALQHDIVDLRQAIRQLG